MTNEEAREQIENLRAHCSDMARSAFTGGEVLWAKDVEALAQAIKALEQEPCEMTVEEYRQQMIQAFHNADCDELIAICVLPTEKEFDHLEWLLKNHYKKEPCEAAINRQSAILLANDLIQDLPDNGRIAEMVLAHNEGILEYQTKLSLLPPVTPQHTEAEIQKIQEMEQTEIQKAYELGKAERPRIGHWNTYKLSQGGIDEEWLECSECMWSNALLIPRNYCPNCGAKMEGEE